MRFFREIQRVQLTPKLIAKARLFAEQVVGTVDYQDSNQVNREKIRQDHFISKLGEEAVRAVFLQYAEYVSFPDYHIYQKKAKSWDSDLQINGLDLAVKTQRSTQAAKYGLSWTFQASAVRRDPILYMPNHWVCFVECDDTGKMPSYICSVYPARQIRELLFEEPVLPHLKGKKKVVYAKNFF